MKKVFVALVLVIMLMPNAYATGMGGFYDANYVGVTVKEVKNMPDEAYVSLKGNIVKRLTVDEYLFSDKTGSIIVEIDDEEWAGQMVKPNDMIEVTGEIDKNYRNTKVDVESLRILK